jgi:hypothetical protein
MDLFVFRPTIYFNCKWEPEDTGKEAFLALAKILPRPIRKEPDSSDYILVHETDALRVHVSVERSKVCQLVEAARPAVYECTPLLSKLEEEELGGVGGIAGLGGSGVGVDEAVQS